MVRDLIGDSINRSWRKITTSDWIFLMSETVFLSGNFFSAHGAGPPPASFQLARVDSFCAQEQVLTRSRTFCRASGSRIVPRSDPQCSDSRYRLCVHLMLLLCGDLSWWTIGLPEALQKVLDRVRTCSWAQKLSTRANWNDAGGSPAPCALKKKFPLRKKKFRSWEKSSLSSPTSWFSVSSD